MDSSACAVLYLDGRAASTGPHTRDTLLQSDQGHHPLHSGHEHVTENIRTLVAAFGEVFVFSDGVSCIGKVAELNELHNTTGPILVLLDIPQDDDTPSPKASPIVRTPSPTSSRRLHVESNEPSDLYGTQLLLYFKSDMQQRARSRLVVPVAVLRHHFDLISEPLRVSRYLDNGAVDVLTKPFTVDRLQGLTVHAYRRFKEAASREDSSFALTKRNRKRSWVGMEEERPYAYLREVMVSGLMDGICDPDAITHSIDSSTLNIPPTIKRAVETAIGTWSFSAHDYDADALLYAALLMLEHALSIPELEKWRMSRDDLTTFLMACRNAYNDFVLYHNFRHIVDVLQAVFFFLLKIGILPPYQSQDSLDPKEAEPSGPLDCSVSAAEIPPVAMLLKPFDALTLLISAIGHDVGHPGVNNAFLVALNAPLAQLYNDRSVLEAFHCAAYSQILRRYWPEAFADIAMRKLMINSILATDMGLHFKYMIDMANLQERVNATPVEDWAEKAREETRDLCCGLLIKCADISNVARKYDTAAQWASILTDEFSNQGAMEAELNLPTCLFGGPPDKDDVIKMAESQIGFMNIFARPLFEAMANVLPAMEFGVQEMLANQEVWQEKIRKEKIKRQTSFNWAVGDVTEPSSTAVEMVNRNEDLEKETEDLPSLLVERDSLLSPPRSPHAVDEPSRPWSESGVRFHHDSFSSASSRHLRNASMGSLSPTRGIRKPSGTGSLYGQFSAPFAHAHGGSRRSSKDAALETLEQMQLNGFSRPSYDTGRRGSADASLTTILVRSQTPQNRQETGSPSHTPSPARQHPRSASQPSQAGWSSLPSSRSNATSNTAGTATMTTFQSSSTQASSLNEMECAAKQSQETSEALGGGTFLSPESHGREQRQTLSAPDILSIPEIRYSKPNLVSQMARAGSEEGEEAGTTEHNRTIRQSRSRSRLRGLKFWRKRWKSPSGVDQVEGSE